MSSLKHIHSYIRYKNNQFKRRDLFKCNDPSCTHFAEKSLILGKNSLCSCGTVFILTNEDLKRAKPRCIDCSNTVEGIKRRKIKNMITDAFNNVMLEPAAVTETKTDFEI